jgi:hypothetical protein
MEAMYLAFKASPALSGVQVEEAFPGPDRIKDSCVFLGDARSSDVHIPVNRPVRVARQEDYLVDVHCQVQVPGSNAKPARDAVFALYAAIEDVLATNPTLSVDGNVRCLTTNYDLQTGMTDVGWAAFLKIEVSVNARLY